VPTGNIDESLAEIERALDGIGLDGVNVLTNVAGVYLGDASLEPVMAELNRRKAVVFIHPTSPACWECTSLGYPRPMIEFPFDTTRAVTNMLLSGSFTRHPDIRWIVPHAGGTLPFLAPRIAGISAMLGADDPAAVLAQLRRLHYDLAGSANPPVVAALLGFVERSQVLYGSDWPFTPEQIVGAGLGWVNGDHNPISPGEMSAAAIRLFPRFAR
jgi:predicted TIM-barrel fold metal-dependent hydrolase